MRASGATSILLRPIGRYLWPWLLYCASVVALVPQAPWSGPVAGGLYVIASIWWIVATAAAAHPRPGHFAMVWIPSVPPVLILILFVWAFTTIDAAAMALAPMVAIALAFLLASLGGAIALWARSRRGRPSDG